VSAEWVKIVDVRTRDESGQSRGNLVRGNAVTSVATPPALLLVTIMH